MNFYREKQLSSKGSELVQFDAGSIRQVAAAERLPEPETWLADPDEYERNGRVFRDSQSPRMLAYSPKNHIVYATDGCNSCARRLRTPLEKMSAEQLHLFARENDLRVELLEKLVEIQASAGDQSV